MSLLNEGKANTHLTHLEELVLTQGPAGYNMARAFLLELLETLKGNSRSHVQTSVKWDGAPAIFAGINPENGKFFVGTKSIFNKEPKINYTPQDIITNHGHAPGLVDKLTKALKYLPSLGINKILQGDFMFDDGMLDIIDVGGEPHYRFKPNTIVYAVPIDSELGKEIGQSKFGIVFHTTYDSLDSGASFGADISGLKRVPGIWFDDAFFTDDTGTVTLTENEERRVVSLVKKADEVNNKINYDNLPSAMLNIYINSEIKAGQFLEDPRNSFQGFLQWYSRRLEKKVDSLKSEKGKGRAVAKGEEDLQSFENRKEDILDLFRVSRLLFEAKNIFISKYNNAVYKTKHFVDDGSGDLVATNPEGYVAVDHAGNGVKFVDRLEFSRANFAMDKGFAKEVNETLTVYWGGDGFSTTKTLNEWATNLPKTSKTNKTLYQTLQTGTPITSLIQEASQVKQSLAEAIHWAITEQGAQKTSLNWAKELVYAESAVHDKEGKRLIAIYPGRFQPMGPHHAATYWKLAEEFGVQNTFVATSDLVKPPKSPLNFDQKKDIMVKHGIPEDQIVHTRNPYQATEITGQFDPGGTAVVFAVGQKDMDEQPRFANLGGKTKKGTPAYYKKFGTDDILHSLDRHGYITVAPHIDIDIPGVGEMSGTALRQILASAEPEEFEKIMGWFDQEIYNMIRGKLEEMSSMGGGNVQGAATDSDGGSPWHGFDAVAFNKREKERATLRGAKEFVTEEELVNEVADYLLGISVG